MKSSNDTRMTDTTSSCPNSIPKSVFHHIVKDVVQESVHDTPSFCGWESSRVSSKAVALLQATAEQYITEVFKKSGVEENKILNVEAFMEASKSHEEEETKTDTEEGMKTILDYESGDEIF